MRSNEINTFFLLAYVFIAVLIVAVIVFIFQMRARKIRYEKEKDILQEQHEFEMVMRRLEIQKQTMQDIGREIHDNVGQQLTLAVLYARQMQLIDREKGDAERLSKITGIINNSLSDLRSLSKTLTDNAVQQTLLHELLERECYKVNELGTCAVIFNSNIQLMAVGYQAKASILRLVQEFMQNSLRHSSCTHIWIKLHLSDQHLEMTLKDDGTGFDASLLQTSGVGLDSMKQRALVLDAEFTLTSNAQEGTLLKVIIPGTKLLY